MARHQPTPETRRRVIEYVAADTPHASIAFALGISIETLARFYRGELEHGAAIIRAENLADLTRLSKGDDTKAAIAARALANIEREEDDRPSFDPSGFGDIDEDDAAPIGVLLPDNDPDGTLARYSILPALGEESPPGPRLGEMRGIVRDHGGAERLIEWKRRIEAAELGEGREYDWSEIWDRRHEAKPVPMAEPEIESLKLPAPSGETQSIDRVSDTLDLPALPSRAQALRGTFGAGAVRRF